MDNKIILKKNLIDVCKILDNHKITPILLGGTLLGLLRDKNFIDGDLDIDLGVIVKEGIDLTIWYKVFKNLENAEFTIRRASSRGVITFDRGYGCDIWWINKKWDQNKMLYYGVYAWNGEFRYPAENFDNLDTLVWEGKKYNIPYNPELHLQCEYGDWKTPNPNFKQPHDSPCFKIL
jgi:phosphorylcholine metabolism protein LicD